MKAFLTVGEAARFLSVCTKTIRRWDKAGKILCHRTPGGHRRITIVEIERLMTGQEDSNKITGKDTAIYCRVSSHEQKKKGDLQRQVQLAREYCTKQGYSTTRVFQDVGSGLNAKRRGMKKLCRVIERGEIERVVIIYSDRLTRFGFDYLTRYFSSHGTAVEVVEEERKGKNGEKSTRSMEKELVQDLIAIVTSFSGRVHGLRSSRARRKKQAEIRGKQLFPTRAGANERKKGLSML